MTYDHYLDDGLKKWIVVTARRNYWRVSAWYDLDDLIQDGYLCYQKCVVKYARLIRKRRPSKDDRRNFMALVKRAYENHIHDLASKRTDQKEYTLSTLSGDDEDYSGDRLLETKLGATYSDAQFRAWLAGLSRPVRRVFEQALEDIEQGRRVTATKLNAELCAALGRKSSIDSISQVYEYLEAVRPALLSA